MKLGTLSVWVAAGLIGIALPAMAQDEAPQIYESGTASISTPLNIESGQTVVIDFASSPHFVLPEGFTNSGTVYLTSSSQSVTSGTLTAANIANLQGGIITSVLPTGGIAGMPNLLPSFSFTLNSLGTLVNEGSITSSGSLTMAAVGTITNTNSAIVSAVQNLNIASMASVFNAGNITSALGSINVDTANLQNSALINAIAGSINLTNTLRPELGVAVEQTVSGVVQALTQQITVETLNKVMKQPVTINGGTMAAAEILVNAGEGHASIDLNDINGPIGVSAGTASLAVRDGTNGLTISHMNLTGDPDLIYSGMGPFSSGAFNTLGGFIDIDTSMDTVNGSITFTGPITTAQPVVGLGPSGYVKLNAGTTITTGDINASALALSGGNINLRANGNITSGILSSESTSIAGSVLVVSTNGNVTTGNISSVGGLAAGAITVSGGGNVVLGNLSAGALEAGNITLLSRGNLSAGTISATSSGSVAGQVYAAAGTGTAGNLSLGTINLQSLLAPASVTLLAKGSISLADVLGSSGSPIGSQVSIISAGSPSPATLTVGNIGTMALAGGSVIIVNTSGNVLFNNIQTFAASVGGDVSITASNNIVGGQINTFGSAGFGGDAWLSAGGTSGTSISVATIERFGALGSGQLFVLHEASASFASTVMPAPSGADFIGTPTAIVRNITSDTTLSATSGAVTGFAPGGFNTINAPGATLTVDLPVRVPIPIVAKDGGIALAGVTASPALPINQSLNFVAPGDINLGALPAVSGGIGRIVSTGGTVVLPNINFSAAVSPGALLASGNNGVTLPNGASVLTTVGAGIGGPIAISSPNGSVNLGSPGNTSNNALNTAGTIRGGAITLFAGGQVNNNNVTLNSSGVTPGVQKIVALLIPPQSVPVPISVSTPTAAVAQPQSQQNLMPVAFVSPVIARTGTILPTDTLPVEFPASQTGAASSKDSVRRNERLAIIQGSDFSASAISRLSQQGLDLNHVSDSNAVSLNSGAAVFAPDKDIIVLAGSHTVKLKAGTIALISANFTDIAVYDLYDKTNGDVTVDGVTLFPGQMITRGAAGQRPDGLSTLKRIATRSSTAVNFKDESGYIADFSILSALSEMQDLRPLFKANTLGAKQIASCILKSAAIQMQMSGGRDVFKAAK